jgi:lysophospholipase L1-like esterase
MVGAVMKKAALALVALVALWAAPARAEDAAKADKFFFKDGDFVVMIGDSITEQRLYSSYVEMWTVTRFPAWKLTFRNVGIGGDTSTGGNRRFQRDVVRFNPTAMTVDFGMNDGGYGGFKEDRFNAYFKGLQGMADQAKAAKIRTAWVTPQPLDNGDPGKDALKTPAYNETLERFSKEGVEEIAKKNDGLFVDQFHPYLAVLNKARARAEQDPYKRITGGDAVHPGPAGQSLMAASILKGLSFPKLVASVEIDLTAARPQVKATNCKVTDLDNGSGTLTFKQLDDAIPFFPPEAFDILNWSPVLEDLNEYRLKVTGLSDRGKYEVRVGGKALGIYDARKLAEGVNLAPVVLKNAKEADRNPVLAQALAVKAAVEKKTNYFHDQIFSVMRAKLPLDEKSEATIKERLEKMPEYDDAIRKALEMKAHTVEVAPVKGR